MSAVVSKKLDKWYVSISVENPIKKKAKKTPAHSESQAVVGVDLGIKTFATLSTGEKIPGPKPNKTFEKKLKHLQRELSRKKRGSNNYNKAKKKLAKAHAYVANIRKDYIHKLTTRLATGFDRIGIEDLHVKGMVKNHCLAKAIHDMGFGEFRRQMCYKTEFTPRITVVAPRFFPSSKLCNYCSYKMDKLPLNIRTWICPNCGVEHDRDINAAKNLEKLAVGFTVIACGGSSSGLIDNNQTKLFPMNQEPNTMQTPASMENKAE